ncbi:uncharacterized protein V6R79_012348 [Siganus canaliculatus]
MFPMQRVSKNVGNLPTKKKTQNKSKKMTEKVKYFYCTLCRKSYFARNAQDHMHSMPHHRQLDNVLGVNSFHDCQACKKSSMDLHTYSQHIFTVHHKTNLTNLISRKVKPLPLTKTLNPDAMRQILERNKLLKQQAKRLKKQRKRQKNQVYKRQAEMQKKASVMNNTVMSRVEKLELATQMNSRLLKQMKETQQTGSNFVVVQNKENKTSSLQRPVHQYGANLQMKSGRQMWQNHYVNDQRRQDGGFTVSRPSVQATMKSSANNRPTSNLLSNPKCTSNASTQMPSATSSQPTDFTSDRIPQNGAIIFSHSQDDDGEPSEIRQEDSQCSKQPAAAKKPANAAPVQEVDISAMLWQIRRALGVREPCRADRKARKQNSEAAHPQTAAKKDQPAGDSVGNYSTEQTSAESCPAPAVPPTVGPSDNSVTKPQLTVTLTQDTLSSQASSSQHLGGTSSPEPNPNITRKVRIAHKPGKVQAEKQAGLKPALNKLLSSSGSSSKLSWREMYDEMRRKKQLERFKGTPRFGVKPVPLQLDQEKSLQVDDQPLSEGFQWETFPDSPSTQLWTQISPPLKDSTDHDSHTVTQSNCPMQEQPGVAQEGCSVQVAEAFPVKVERSLQEENRGLIGHGAAKKRKSNVEKHDGVSDETLRGKRKKAKSNMDQDQMNQLLSVSLREEELSQSLQDLDTSLIQARDMLQAAYTEVQRLLLMKQQCTMEVNGLRAQRITILQGMQGGYSEDSSAPEKPSASSAEAPKLSPLPPEVIVLTSSSSPQQCPATSSSSIGNPQPTSLHPLPLKQEPCQPPAVPSNPDVPQLPLNHPFTPLPSNSTTILTSSPSAAPSPAAPSLNTLANPSSVSVVREESAKPARSVTAEVISDSDEETGGGGGGGGSRLAAEKPISSSVLDEAKNAPAEAPPGDGGNESDDSVKVTEPSNQEVINLDESDSEENVAQVPFSQEPPQKSVKVEFCDAGTTMVQQEVVERKVEPGLAAEDASDPPESAEVLKDEELFLGSFEKHIGPVHSLQIHNGLLYTCSGDNTARAYSLTSKECRAEFKGHTNKVNCLLVSSLPNLPARLFTGSSDQTIRCYSIKSYKCLEQIFLLDRVLCLHMAWNILFVGLANGSVVSYDLKTLRQLDVFECHGPRGVSCLGTAQEGARRVLLVGSYDSTISVRDAKSGLLLRSLEGHTKTVLCMKVVNDLVFSGSSDTSVHAHNIHTGELVRIYKGHSHAVTSIAILGKVMVTACLDQLIRVYELQSHDRLQVYGGLSDMVTCMAIHKSVIYTGCYDGSVQAVKLNLMKNYRCLWQNCSLIFGVDKHLVQHLTKDHSNPNLERVKCRWKGCCAFFAENQSVRQELPEHMQKHVDKDSQVQP